MTVGKLKEELEKLNVPDTAEIFICADHGQNDERAYEILASKGKAYESEDYVWESCGFRTEYDEYDLQDYNENDDIIAVCIFS